MMLRGRNAIKRGCRFQRVEKNKVSLGIVCSSLVGVRIRGCKDHSVVLAATQSPNFVCVAWDETGSLVAKGRVHDSTQEESVRI